jgi:hypothetical protein
MTFLRPTAIPMHKIAFSTVDAGLLAITPCPICRRNAGQEN